MENQNQTPAPVRAFMILSGMMKAVRKYLQSLSILFQLSHHENYRSLRIRLFKK